MGLLLRVLILSMVLTGCDTLNKYLPLGDTVVETPDGEKYSCVSDMKTCMKTCDVVRKDGLKIKQSYKLPTDVCSLPEAKVE